MADLSGRQDDDEAAKRHRDQKIPQLCRWSRVARGEESKDGALRHNLEDADAAEIGEKLLTRSRRRFALATPNS